MEGELGAILPIELRGKITTLWAKIKRYRTSWNFSR